MESDNTLLRMPVDVMPYRNRRSITLPPERPVLIHREPGILEVLRHFFTHLETVRTDGRAQDGPNVRRYNPLRII